jgi:hypothetical protein
MRIAVPCDWCDTAAFTTFGLRLTVSPQTSLSTPYARVTSATVASPATLDATCLRLLNFHRDSKDVSVAPSCRSCMRAPSHFFDAAIITEPITFQQVSDHADTQSRPLDCFGDWPGRTPAVQVQVVCCNHRMLNSCHLASRTDQQRTLSRWR